MAELWLFLIALATIYLIPGPDMVLLLGTSMTAGRRIALATAIGFALARAAHVMLAAIGLAVLFQTTPWAYDIVRLFGAGYLIYLGVAMLFSVSSKGQMAWSAESLPVRRVAYHNAIWRGLLTNLLNPKAVLFCSVILPQFTQTDGTSITHQFAVLGVILVVVGFLFDLLYLLSGSYLKAYIARGGAVRRIQTLVFGSLLIGLGVRLALDTSR